MGASAIRYAGLEGSIRDIGVEVRDVGNVSTPVAESMDSAPSRLKYLEPIVKVAEEIDRRVSACVEEDWLPLVLGGDHSISLGTVTGVSRHKKVGILWLDAHGDFNTAESSPSGNIHGMVLAALAGLGDERLVSVGGFQPKVAPRNIALVGVREIDSGEREMLRSTGVHVFTMHDIDRAGLPIVMAQAIERAAAGVDGLHVSLDLDVVDPIQAPGVGTPVIGGLSFRETHLAMELVSASRQLMSLDVVEVNPILDTHNDTARLAVQFALSALGKRIM